MAPTPHTPPLGLLTLAEIHERTGIARSTLYTHALSGRLRARRVYGRNSPLLVTADALERYLAQRAVPEPTAA